MEISSEVKRDIEILVEWLYELMNGLIDISEVDEYLYDEIVNKYSIDLSHYQKHIPGHFK